MQLKRRKPPKSLTERTFDVVEEISVLETLQKYPDSEKKLKFIAGLIAQFCETDEVEHVDPDNPQAKTNLGWVRPIEWLVQQVGQTHQFFPAPIVWRRIYETRFVPIDGACSADLEAASE